MSDLVQSLVFPATKTASGAGNASSQVRAHAAAAFVSQDKTAPATPAPQGVPPAEKVQETAKAVAAQIESYLRSVGREVELSIDADSGETIITVRDANTGELIRQIPSAEALRLSQALAHRPALVDTLA
jgi:flagellar protein FlaG